MRRGGRSCATQPDTPFDAGKTVGIGVAWIVTIWFIIRQVLQLAREFGAVLRECGGMARLARDPAGFADDAGRLFGPGHKPATPEQRARIRAAADRVEARGPIKAGKMTRLGKRYPVFGQPARFGNAAHPDYVATFVDAFPETEGKVWVHHAVPRVFCERYGAIAWQEFNSLENLRGVPLGVNRELHLSRIARMWHRFRRDHGPGPFTKQELLDFATTVDDLVGRDFEPPVR